MCYPYENDTFILDSDASGHAIGAVLSQVQNGKEKVIAYASKTLSESQRKYCTTYRELLAVVTFVKYFRHYLLGQKFKIRTDHASLIWLKNFKNPEGMVARGISILDSYNFEIEHRKGSQHTNADSLSRKPYRLCKREDCPFCTESSCTNFSENLIRQNIAPVRAQKSETDETILYTESENDETLPYADDSFDQEGPINISNWLRIWTNAEIVTWQSEDPDISKIIELKSNFEQKPGREEVSGLSYEIRNLWSL